jgi:hypothetical protein
MQLVICTFDIRVPEQITVSSHTHTHIQDVKVFNNHMFSVTDNSRSPAGMQVFDLTRVRGKCFAKQMLVKLPRYL